ncbi:MAG: FAD-binding oxidoreductase [Alphaproteobacteria bacterium]|nr:FAD-binding oxidoreductase [Alphaproteobacteria bacterium]
MNLLTANDVAGKYPPSYYADVSHQLEAFAPAVGALKCDVCVVGGGYTGLSSALHLAQKGYDVILLDAQRIGFGASGRNGGQVGQGQRLDQDELEPLMGKERARGLWDIATQSVDLVRELAKSDLVECEFHDGIIHADHRKRYVRHSLDYAKKLQDEYGYDKIRGLERDEVRELIGSDAYYGGTLDLGAGHINPLAFAFGLARMAVAAGVRIFEQSEVTGLQQTLPAVVTTDKAQIDAEYVVLACNGYLGDLNKKVASIVMPINNYIVATEPLPVEQREALIRHNYAVADSKFVVNYFRFSDEGRMLFGGTESYGYRFPQNIADKVRKPMGVIFPQLKHVKIDYAWGGTLGITMNRMPHFERLAGNVLSLSGYSGHGVAMATLAGKIAAEVIAGQAERFDLMAEVPNQRFPGGAALRTPLLALAMLYYSLRDKL